jgi:hypothetical protein
MRARSPWPLILVIAPLLAGCGLFGKPSFTCRAGTHPCGDGCIPTLAVCCDDGSGSTSSYCTNGAAGCVPNTDARGCNAVFPAGVRAQFCCGESGTIGSNDCPEGEHHCGTLCQPVGEPCCPPGSSSADCPERSWDSAGCQVEAGRVGCGVCVEKKVCVSCGPGFCCQGGQVCGGQGAQCIAGSACTGMSGGAGSGGGSGSDACAKYDQNYCTSSGGMQFLGAYIPKTCPCPSNTRTDGRGALNELCGLPGKGTDCKLCECQ